MLLKYKVNQHKDNLKIKKVKTLIKIQKNIKQF